MEEKILLYLKEHETEIFEDLTELVLAEASSADTEALAQVREVLSGIITRRIGVTPYIYDSEEGGYPVRFCYGEGEETVLLVGHYDTVVPIGSMKLRQEGNELHGPGVLDMKSGVISAIWAMKAYQDLGINPGKRLTAIISGAEEVPNAKAAEIICDLAKDCKLALVCEPAAPNGDLKTGRKGTFTGTITVHGKAAHAGNGHKEGVNAIEELAREILFIQGLTDYEKGTTLNVGVCSGGTKANVVLDRASLTVDCRFTRISEGERIIEILKEMQTTVPGTTREIEIRKGPPAMEENEAAMELFALAKECGEKLGLSFSHQFVGGASDGNRISAMGIPVLDGLGAVGDGAHAVNEHIRIDQYIPRIALLASLILRV